MSEEEKRRYEFLRDMYREIMGDIDRHITILWQSATVLFTSLASLSLIKEEIISRSSATALVLIASTWQILHVIDASYWYNRNLAIIANIERQFLYKSDDKEIHYYFKNHRKNNKMISHLKIQALLGWAILFGSLGLNFDVRKIKYIFCFYEENKPLTLEYSETLFSLFSPYILAIFCICLIFYYHQKDKNSYQEFILKSPGKDTNE